jgi:hypothetical protein
MIKKLFLFVLVISILLPFQALAKEVAGLILYLPFDDGSGDTAKDLSGKGNNGKITGAKWTAGKYGKALDFDGKSFVEVASSGTLEALVDEMTVMAWINPKLTGNAWQGIVTKGNDAAEHFELLLNIDGHVHTAQIFADGRKVADRAGKTLNAGEWQHLAITYKPGKWIYYLNAEVKNDSALANAKLGPDGKPVVIGDEKPLSRLYQGIIDEVAIFNKALSQDEIKNMMGGISSLLSVELKEKLSSTWAKIKTH